ncbi:MAG: hypothetical protein IJR57_07020 [Ruminococcus sp.]|nr:hypothetical protein [Ruminococcus sp.]
MSDYKNTYELYQSVLDEVHAPDHLTQRIKSMDTKHLKRSKNIHILAVAACLAFVMIVVAVAVGKGTDLFNQVSVSTNSQVARYSYDNKKLLMICRMDISPNANNNDNINTEEYDINELRSQVGTGIFGVNYADDEKVVITTGKGVLVYNYKLNKMINTFDLDKIRIPGFNQGDKASYIRVDRSGEYAIIESSDNWGDIERVVEYHILFFKSGEVNKINKSEIPKDFSLFETEPIKYYPDSDSDKEFDLPYSWPGEITASYINSKGESITFYTNIERSSDNKVIVGNTDLVIVSPDKSYTTQRVFGCFFPEFNN